MFIFLIKTKMYEFKHYFEAHNGHPILYRKFQLCCSRNEMCIKSDRFAKRQISKIHFVHRQNSNQGN